MNSDEESNNRHSQERRVKTFFVDCNAFGCYAPVWNNGRGERGVHIHSRCLYHLTEWWNRQLEKTTLKNG
jgi:hypothetical protein